MCSWEGVNKIAINGTTMCYTSRTWVQRYVSAWCLLTIKTGYPLPTPFFYFGNYIIIRITPPTPTKEFLHFIYVFNMKLFGLIKVDLKETYVLCKDNLKRAEMPLKDA